MQQSHARKKKEQFDPRAEVHEYTPPAVDSEKDSAQIAAQLDNGSPRAEVHEYTPPSVDSGSDSVQIAAQLDTGSPRAEVHEHTSPDVDFGSDSVQIAAQSDGGYASESEASHTSMPDLIPPDVLRRKVPTKRGKPRNALTYNVSNAIWKTVREWWSQRQESTHVFKDAKHLKMLLFGKVSRPVPQDFWIPGATPQGQAQHVTAVVSEEHVLHQLRNVIQVRERWLELGGFPMTFQMRDKLERKDFLDAVKAEFHGRDDQRQQQQRDAKDETKKVQDGKHSRWSRDLQLRCGSKVMWEMVSFTGRFDLDFLSQRPAEKPDIGKRKPDLKVQAVKCRGDLRWAEYLARKRKKGQDNFTSEDHTFLRDFDSGKLRRLANEAGIAHGHGRIKYADGSHVDIGPGVGGATRSLLDNFVPPVVLSSDEEGGKVGA